MDVVYFSVNNWMSGENYPPLDCFRKWLGDDLNQTFRNDAWCKENKLCVYYGVVDMSRTVQNSLLMMNTHILPGEGHIKRRVSFRKMWNLSGRI